MTDLQGRHVWYELMTPDPAAAVRFYGAVLGWAVRDANQPGMDYHLLSTPDGDVAGVLPIPSGAPMPPGWFGYVGVDDLDASLAALRAAGGTVPMPAMTVPGVGRMAMVADPQGIIFYLMQPAGSTPSDAFSPTLAGHCAWNELSTPDQPAALGFYQRLLGWTLGDAMDMGDLGQYRFINHGNVSIGAVTPAMPGAPIGWVYYFRVAEIDAAVAAATAAGGRIVQGPVPVPGDEHVIVGTDPQGATFALVGKRVAA
jgi:predicted enzyme related to lactoylglutathione lyase